MSPPPTLRLAVDGDAVAANWQALSGICADAAVGAAVKADAYGLGVDRVVPGLAAAGCRDFFVAHWSEAPAMLRHVDPAQLSVLHGPMTSAECEFARATGVRPVINSIEQARRWQAAGGGVCDLMVDTGMNRLGVRPEQLGDGAIAALDIDILMSHLACADEDSTMNEAQRLAFEPVCRAVAHRRSSLANSAGTVLGHAYHLDLARPGIALYGGVVRPELAELIRPTVQPQCAVIQVRTVPAGESISYGATYCANRAMRVGIVSLGYADGYLRCWSDIGAFHAGETRLPVLGRVTMDMTAIDLTAAPQIGEGDWVSAEYDLPEAARKTGLSQYELLTILGPRLRG